MVKTPDEVAALVARLDPTLRPILELELERGNRIDTATPYFGWSDPGVTVYLERALDLDAIARAVHLDAAVESYSCTDSHYPLEAGFLNRDKRQGIVGPLPPPEPAQPCGPIPGPPPGPPPWAAPSPFWPPSADGEAAPADGDAGPAPPSARLRPAGRRPNGPPGGAGGTTLLAGREPRRRREQRGSRRLRAALHLDARRPYKVAFAILLAVLVAFFVFAYFRFPGKVLVVAPAAGPVTVRVDGEEEGRVPAGQRQRFSIEQGHRTVELAGPAGLLRHEIAVESGYFERLLPVAAQCFVEIDVTAWYERGRRDRDLDGLEIVARRTDQTPFAHDRFRADVYDSPDELPDRYRRALPRHLLLEFSCALAWASDEDVLADALAPWR